MPADWPLLIRYPATLPASESIEAIRPIEATRLCHADRQRGARDALAARSGRAAGPSGSAIGVLTPYAAADPEGQARTSAFINTLQGFGWTDARNPRIEVRWFAGNVERAKADAAELVGLAPDVIVVGSNPGLAVLRLLTRTIPVVFTQVSDPIDSGFVSGLARPGGTSRVSRISSRPSAASG